MTLAEQQQELKASLAQRRDPQERLAWLVEEARRRPMMDAALRTDAHRVEGCLARLWLVRDLREGRCYYQSESDSLIVKAVAGLLCEFYSGHSPAEIRAHPPDFLNELGITQHLTPNRRNGLSRVWTLIREFAEAADVSAAPPLNKGSST
jgi:cysteine desulfuration protein SufE